MRKVIEALVLSAALTGMAVAAGRPGSKPDENMCSALAYKAEVVAVAKYFGAPKDKVQKRMAEQTADLAPEWREWAAYMVTSVYASKQKDEGKAMEFYISCKGRKRLTSL